jgi:hypothetical protein
MNKIIIISVIFLAVVGLTVLRLQRRRDTKMEFKSTQAQMEYLASEAVKMADQNFGVKLDYSPDSVKQVEKVLGQLHDEYIRTKPTGGVRGLAMAYGAYIGEVIRRNETDVRWERSDAVGGENSYPLIWRGGSSYVCAWCFRRITNGDEDNVWFKYVAIKERTLKHAGGDQGGATNGNQGIHSDTN